MNRLTMMGISTVAAAATAAGGLAVATSASAAAGQHPAARQAALTGCRVARQNVGFPKGPTSYRAGAAGSVLIGPVNSGTIRVAGIHPATGYHAYVDTRRGSSVDVYLSFRKRHVKFEAEVNDAGGLTVTVTSCGR
ncbi:MAG TPA: hypothetical protein VN840_19775 [Streptosporangiaceae bacterium]|nr:hypothetical protein [Streptosporangiaceae bacterium]